MEPKTLIALLDRAEALKNNTRHSWTSTGRRESVAEHSWRLSLMALLVRDEFPGANMDRVLQMCVLHDLGEAFTGDIPSFQKTAADEARESRLLAAWVGRLPPPYARDWAALFAEMDALQTQEAKNYKAQDNLEAVVQHNEAPLSSWLPLEHTLQLTYGADKVAFSPYLTALKEQLNADSRQKMAGADFAPALPDYSLLTDQLRGFCETDPAPMPLLSNAAALLWQAMPNINWVGFYLVRGDTLVLGPFQGKPACIHIALGKGVCGTAAAQNRVLRVEDVHAFPGHIACDAASNAEIVLPLCRGGQPAAVLDIDSPITGRFTEADARGLTLFAQALADGLRWA